MRNKRITISSIWVLICISLCLCLINRYRIHKAVKESKIIIPSLQFEKLSSFASQFINDTVARANIIVFIDSSRCAQCEIQRLGDWNYIVQKVNEITDVNFYYIIESTPKDVMRIKEMFERIRPIQNVYLDYNHLFLKTNPIVENSLFHVLLTDSNGKIKIIGNPTRNKEIEQSYYDCLREYVSND